MPSQKHPTDVELTKLLDGPLRRRELVARIAGPSEELFIMGCQVRGVHVGAAPRGAQNFASVP